MKPDSLERSKPAGRRMSLEQRIEQVVKENGERRVEIIYLRGCRGAGQRLRQKISGVIVRMKLDSALLEYDPVFQDKIVVDAVELLEQCVREYDSVLRRELARLKRFWTDTVEVAANRQDLI
ncbi:hypothetical protein MMC13_003419 [Lambiella insularis]|nr:hypothetical protein [Lambiella insularis]